MYLDLRPLEYWVNERESIRIKKEELELHPDEWTADPIFKQYRFCNVRREDDRVTRWIHYNVRLPYKDHPHLWFMLCICRYINWPDTLADLIKYKAWPTTRRGYDHAKMADVLAERSHAGEKVYTGAYMIHAGLDRIPKHEYLTQTVFAGVWNNRRAIVDAINTGSMRNTVSALTQNRGWGNFMAYQATVDMRFTPLLDHSFDRFHWAAAGPGTIRGLNRLNKRPPQAAMSQDEALAGIRYIWERIPAYTGVEMDFSDIPNILCELDKYLRVKNNEGAPRSNYVAGRGY